MASLQQRRELSAVMRALADAGLNQGAAGNASVRTPEGMLITPTGLKPALLQDDSPVEMALDGTCAPGQLRPSSEWHFHAALYRHRLEIGAVVHVHSPFATALACQRRDIPAFHYMISVAGGDSIRCGEYALFGTDALSSVVLAALDGRSACLLANHGLVATGATLAAAHDLTLAVEDLAHQYCLALQCGGPVLLTAQEMSAVLERFKTYGQQAVE
ncbi:MAG: class II aldolase [Gammaproteobacteria bacterium]|nr:class II aldolase [Gammaproteobacteria bacterium]